MVKSITPGPSLFIFSFAPFAFISAPLYQRAGVLPLGPFLPRDSPPIFHLQRSDFESLVQDWLFPHASNPISPWLTTGDIESNQEITTRTPFSPLDLILSSVLVPAAAALVQSSEVYSFQPRECPTISPYPALGPPCSNLVRPSPPPTMRIHTRAIYSIIIRRFAGDPPPKS